MEEELQRLELEVKELKEKYSAIKASADQVFVDQYDEQIQKQICAGVVKQSDDDLLQSITKLKEKKASIDEEYSTLSKKETELITEILAVEKEQLQHSEQEQITLQDLTTLASMIEVEHGKSFSTKKDFLQFFSAAFDSFTQILRSSPKRVEYAWKISDLCVKVCLHFNDLSLREKAIKTNAMIFYESILFYLNLSYSILFYFIRLFNCLFINTS